MKIIFSLLTIFLYCGFSFAQLKGTIYGFNEGKKIKIYGAKVKLLGENRGVISDEKGSFEIILSKELPDTIVFSAMGYSSDSIVVSKKDRFILLEVNLYSDQLLPEVVASIYHARPLAGI